MKKWLIILLLPFILNGGVVSASPEEDMVASLYEYYEICKQEDIQAYMDIMDFSDAAEFSPGYIDNTRKLTQNVWEVYDILSFDLTDIESVADEEGEFGLIKYHITEVIRGPDSKGEMKTATMDMDYVALMHNVGGWKIVYLMPEVAFRKNVSRLSPADIIAEMLEETVANNPPTALFSIIPAKPKIGDTIVGVSMASDPDGDTLTYSWYVDGEYDSNTGNSPDWEWENPEAGEHTIKLVVEDGKGGRDEYSMKIKVVEEGEWGLPYWQVIVIIVGVLLLVGVRAFRGREREKEK